MPLDMYARLLICMLSCCAFESSLADLFASVFFLLFSVFLVFGYLVFGFLNFCSFGSFPCFLVGRNGFEYYAVLLLQRLCCKPVVGENG